MKLLILSVVINLLFWSGAAKAQDSLLGSIQLVNTYGYEGIFSATSFSLASSNAVGTVQTGFFQGLNLAADNDYSQEQEGNFPLNAEVSVYSSPLNLTDVSPSTPIDSFILLAGQYEFDLDSITLTNANDLPYAQYIYTGTGVLTDTTGQLPSVAATVTIMAQSPDLQGHATDTLLLDAIPEPSAWTLILGTCGVFAFGRFALRERSHCS